MIKKLEQKKIKGIDVDKKPKKKKKKIKTNFSWYFKKWINRIINLLLFIIIAFMIHYNYKFSSNEETVINENDMSVSRTHKFSISEEALIMSSFIRYKTFNRTPEIVADYIAYWVLKLCPEFGIDPSFTLAKIYVESAYEPSRRNNKTGARGLMQVLSKGIGYDKKTQKYKEKFDFTKIYNIGYNIECGLKIFQDKLNMVKIEQSKNGTKYSKNTNLLAKALERYVGASTPEGKKIARKYIEDIYKVQGQYIMWRHMYLQTHNKNEIVEEVETFKNESIK